jgi:hypothetical protein
MSTPDVRRFLRLPFVAQALVLTHSGHLAVKIEDISLKGALVTFTTYNPLKVGESCQLQLELASDTTIVMWGSVAHAEGLQAGLRCEAIDLDSMTHLRRLVELNAGDVNLLDRDYVSLSRRPAEPA